MTVRTRIAPSPTGDPHVGTAYIALFNYCFAKSQGGEFLVRIEDTDQTRSTRESEQMIMDALRWTGLAWDEGPDIGGRCGPYRQSDRTELYREHSDQLLEAGHAFRCFCTAERLQGMRAAQRASGQTQGYDGHCVHLSADEVQAKLDAGEPHVVRMKVPRDGGDCVVHDRLRDPIVIPWREVDMQVLLKSDGMPTYHLANVVDDHHMEITHVIRGEEWISSAPKHILLYEYFGWEAPQLIHLPLLRNPDKSKLSKRKNPTSILYYQRLGVLPEALLNYLGLMGWSMPEENREKFTLQEMVDSFDIDRMSLGGPVFDVVKLRALNGRWLREDLSVEQLGERVAAWALNPAYLLPIAEMLQKRVDVLSDLAGWAGHFFEAVPTIDPEDLKQAQLQDDALLEALCLTLWRLEALRKWEVDEIEGIMRDTAEKLEIKLRHYVRPFYVAMSGKPSSTPLFDSFAHLGPDITRARIRNAVDLLGGVGKKKEKRLRRRYDELFA